MATYKIGRPFSGYEYTTVEADSFEEAIDVADNTYTLFWEYNPETHTLEDGDIWVRNTETLEDRTM